MKSFYRFRKTRRKESRGLSFSDKLSAGGLLLNILLVIGTLWAIKISNDSLKISRQTIDETVKSFTKQNLPFLEIGNFRFSGDTLVYSIYNLGQYPARIISASVGASKEEFFKFESKRVSRPLFAITSEEQLDLYSVNNYITKDNPVDRIYSPCSSYYIGKTDIPGKVYFFARILYKNEINNSACVYECKVQLSGRPENIRADLLHNKNWHDQNEGGFNPNLY